MGNSEPLGSNWKKNRESLNKEIKATKENWMEVFELKKNILAKLKKNLTGWVQHH